MAELLSKQPLSIGGLLDQVFRIAVAAFTAVIPFALVGAVGSLFVNGIQYGDKLGAALGVGALADPSIGTRVAAGLVGVAIYVFVVLAYLGGLCRTYEVATDTPPPSGAWPRARARFWPMVGAIILFALAVIAPTIVAVAVVAGLWGAGMQAFGVVAAFVFLAAFLYLTSRFAVILPEVLLTDRGPVAAIGACWRLTRGQVTRLSIVLLIGFLITFVAYMVLAMIAGIIGALLVKALSLPLLMLPLLLAILISPLAAVLMSPFASALSLSMWNDLRLRAEGHDLDAKIDALADHV